MPGGHPYYNWSDSLSQAFCHPVHDASFFIVPHRAARLQGGYVQSLIAIVLYKELSLPLFFITILYKELAGQWISCGRLLGSGIFCLWTTKSPAEAKANAGCFVVRPDFMVLNSARLPDVTANSYQLRIHFAGTEQLRTLRLYQKSAAVVVATLQVKLGLLFLTLLFGHSECVADLLVKPLTEYSLQHVFEGVTLRRF